MKLNLYVLTPKRIIWDCEVKEIILSTNSGQIGVLPNHAPINTGVDMGPLRIRLPNDQWLTAVLWSGFARIVNMMQNWVVTLIQKKLNRHLK